MIDDERKVRAVLFDFDGTLADSTELVMQCYRHTMTEHLGAPPPDEEWLRGFGTPLEPQIRRFARSLEESDAMLKTYRDYQAIHHDSLLRPFEGVVELVQELLRREVPIAIVTSKHRPGTVKGLDLCGLGDCFVEIVTPEDVTNPKPHPEPVLHALERLKVAPADAVFVGDSPHDIASGRAAGTLTAAALWGPFPRAMLESENPDFLLSSPSQVLDLVSE
ncbi:MAG TPA: HAD-IA family hydrolase [Longimicrobiaceae bacterium]|nr:HAD-IA family hydrolase [Longimicrobiaceae bacterium]